MRCAQPGECAERVTFSSAMPSGTGGVRENVPELRDMGNGHMAACHFGRPFPIPV